jgi:hypothetical protein
MKKHNTFIEFGIIGVMAWLLFICTPFARALEFQFDKGSAANISAPIINSTTNNTFAASANNTAFYVHGANSSAAMGAFGVAASNISIIGTSGVYNFPLNATEMNYDRVGIYYNGTGCLQQYLLVNTVPKEAIDTTSGYASSASTSATSIWGQTDTEVAAIKTQTDKITFDASNRTVSNSTTVGDKTGYSLGGTQTFNNTGTWTGDQVGNSLGNRTGTANLNGTMSY